MVQAPSTAGAATAAANTDSQTRSGAAAGAPGAAAPASGGGDGSSSNSTAASATSSSLAGAPMLGPPRYMRPPRGETDYASSMPDEVLLRVLAYSDLDTCVHASLAAPRWVPLFNEKVAQAHCERIYLDQAHAKVLNPARFQSSYKAMLRHRPRCRMNGFYFLTASYIKKPTRDMWTEVKPGTILEVKYYRYLRFQPNGRLVYGLLYQPPHEAVRIFKEGRHKELSEGQYYVHKGEVVCEVRTHYAIINFKLELQDGARGKFTQLYMKEHSSQAYKDPTGVPVPHKVPYDNFAFYRCTI